VLKSLIAQLLFANITATTGDLPMDIYLDTHFEVEVTRLHCTHLRTLIGRLEGQLTTIEQVLATPEPPPFAYVAPHLNGVAEQSALIAVETERLQGYVHSLLSRSPDAADGTGTETDDSDDGTGGYEEH
jgi:hypothetical protein